MVRECSVTRFFTKDGNPLFAGDQYAGLSEMAKHYIGGL